MEAYSARIRGLSTDVVDHVVMEHEQAQGRQVYDVSEKGLGYDVRRASEPAAVAARRFAGKEQLAEGIS